MDRYKVLKVLLLVPFLMAITCEEDLEPQFVFNTYKVSISPDSRYVLNDTIWIMGRVSSNVFDLTSNDSVFGVEPLRDVFAVFELIEPLEVTNTQAALNQFELIIDHGDFSSISSCDNADLSATPVLDLYESFYSYRIGLKALNPGDYVISLLNATLQNEEKNEFIVEDYPIPNFEGQIGFNRCGSPSWRFVNDSEQEYYFTVE
jgi:hypothetical protein